MSKIVYSVLGASFLWPWNAFITASTLAKSKLSDEPALYASYASIVMTISTLCSLVSTAYLAYRAHNYSQRVKYGEFIIALAFFVLGTVVDWQSGRVWLVLMALIAGISSFGTALVQNGGLAITQRIPGPDHALAIMNGQAIAGVVPPILPLLVSSSAITALAPVTFLSVTFLSLGAFFAFSSKSNQPYIELAETASEEEEEQTPPSWGRLWYLAKQIMPVTISLLLAFTVSLSYPVFANTVESQRISAQYFSPLTHLVWNSGDLVGRVSCSSSRLRLTQDRFLVPYSVARFCFVVYFIVLSRFGNPSDTLYLVSMFLYGVSSGHLISSSIALAPNYVPQNLQPATGGLIGLIIAVGLLLGSAFSFVVVAAL